MGRFNGTGIKAAFAIGWILMKDRLDLAQRWEARPGKTTGSLEGALEGRGGTELRQVQGRGDRVGRGKGKKKREPVELLFCTSALPKREWCNWLPQLVSEYPGKPVTPGSSPALREGPSKLTAGHYRPGLKGGCRD